MTTDYLAIKSEDTVQQVLDIIRQRGQAAETLNFVFVIDDNGVLIDDINIKEFLIVDPATPVEKLMDRLYIALHVNDAQTETISVFRNNSRFALPVINESGCCSYSYSSTIAQTCRKGKYNRNR
jgi:magnesium transporter